MSCTGHEGSATELYERPCWVCVVIFSFKCGNYGVETPFLEVPEPVDGALSSLSRWGAANPGQGLELINLRGPFRPTRPVFSVVLWVPVPQPGGGMEVRHPPRAQRTVWLCQTDSSHL